MTGQRRRTEYMPLTDVLRAPRNPKGHDTDLIARSVSRFGVVELPAIDGRTGRLVAGHGRLDDWAARRASGEQPPDGIDVADDGEWLIPVTLGWASRSDADAEAYLVVSNQSTIAGGWNDGDLAQLLADLRDQDPDLLAVTGFDESFITDNLDGSAGDPWDRAADVGAGGPPVDRPRLADRFGLPPFDVLDGRQGWWRTRKRQWVALGMASEVGRGGNLAFDDITSSDPDYYQHKEKAERQAGRALSHAEFQALQYPDGFTGRNTGTSIFDPVLCELAYRWFSAPGAAVIDPFAGGSVRGITAAILGREYTGVDLRDEQVEANRGQASALLPLDAPTPQWVTGDAAAILPTVAANTADLIFTCPPYYDLETYSDDPRDLSTKGYAEFDQAYASILAAAVRVLRPDRFAVIVVGDARDSKGALHDLRGSTVRAMEDAGCAFVNAGVLLTAYGNAAIRAGRQFVATRTLARVHQDVLVFVKGNRQAAARWCGEVEVHLPDGLDTEEDTEKPSP